MRLTPQGQPALHVYEPTFLRAATRLLAGQPLILEVRRSAVVQDSDWVMAPVWDYLRVWCHALLAEPVTEKDPTMMFGKAQTSTYAVHEDCPGVEVRHECARDEKGMAA